MRCISVLLIHVLLLAVLLGTGVQAQGFLSGEQKYYQDSSLHKLEIKSFTKLYGIRAFLKLWNTFLAKLNTYINYS